MPRTLVYTIGYLPRCPVCSNELGQCGAARGIWCLQLPLWLPANFVCRADTKLTQFPGLRLPKSYRQFLGAVPLTLQILFSIRSRPVTYLHLCGLR
jgi:hypothetical protein